MNNRLMTVFMGLVAISVGALVNYFGDQLISYVAPPPGVRLELFYGVATFNPYWVAALFIPSFFAGVVVSLIYGLGGKVICYFAPIIVRGISYIQMMNYEGLPEGVTVLPFWYWIMVLIVAVEAAAFGGVYGEIVIKKTYGRRPKHTLYKQSSDKKATVSNSDK